MDPKLSVIIPCFNSEKTLEETLNSVLNQRHQNWEALIINDGSNDGTEAIASVWIEKDKRIKYFSKENEGLGKSRNFGISNAAGEYILPLDSDNLVVEDFAEKAVAFLDSHHEVGVVHGHAEYFGEKTGIWAIDEFNLEKILVGNYIDACAIYRKELWEKVGGYDENMPYQGHEDWDFWIALGIQNVRFYHLNQITFRYCVCGGSMINSFNREMLLLNQDYLVQKYSRVFHKYYSRLYSQNESFNSEQCKNKTSQDLVSELLSRIKKALW
ncbi:glycosyltransferase family 2 protein [Salinimicrobium sediminilitoris]|uniref:glycosyltransferase family 2 protein n=1 Tax=Salinimicrobium sediminilitoris TaxID=2876715 RepID=UPI001E651AB0|nr:glycosyltransferase [Salinimicrobium sediminilitoris]MCC8358515.1 glycosyltransferase [Salinimicrobium sediminilitoris]